jgi:hypothetical protein
MWLCGGVREAGTMESEAGTACEVLRVLESWGGVWAWNEANGTEKAGRCLVVEGCMGGRADAEDEGRRGSLSRDRIRAEGRLPFGCGGATRKEKGLDSTPSSACPSPGQRGALASVLLAWEAEAEKERMCGRGSRPGRVGGRVVVAAAARRRCGEMVGGEGTRGARGRRGGETWAVQRRGGGSCVFGMKLSVRVVAYACWHGAGARMRAGSDAFLLCRCVGVWGGEWESGCGDAV